MQTQKSIPSASTRYFTDPETGTKKKMPKFSGKLITLNYEQGNAGGLYNLGTHQLQQKNYENAIECFLKSLKIEETQETLLNLATCYKMLGNHRRSAELLERCIEKFPGFAFPYNNLGLIRYDFRRIPEAIRLYNKALEIKPDYADAHWNLALAQYLDYFSKANLGSYDFAEYNSAMDHFNWRFKKTNPVKLALHHGSLYTGQKLEDGEQVMILCEQGIGDMIQFMRYAYYFRENQVVLHLPESLWCMVRNGYKTTNSSAEPSTKYYIPLMSMSRYFPFSGEKYIDWNGKKELDGSFKIGIVWQGNRKHANDRNRSRHYKDFYWLFKHGTVYSLQKDEGCKAKDIHQLPIDNWEDTMSYINALDIVVTIDTSVAHLCGAMGKPCIVLIPSIGIDWRWGETGERTIWYDSLRLAREQSMAEAERLLIEFKENGNEWK